MYYKHSTGKCVRVVVVGDADSSCGVEYVSLSYFCCFLRAFCALFLRVFKWEEAHTTLHRSQVGGFYAEVLNTQNECLCSTFVPGGGAVLLVWAGGVVH